MSSTVMFTVICGIYVLMSIEVHEYRSTLRVISVDITP